MYNVGNWKTNPEFTDFVKEFPENDHYRSDNLAKDFFDRVKNRYAKHFTNGGTNMCISHSVETVFMLNILQAGF